MDIITFTNMLLTVLSHVWSSADKRRCISMKLSRTGTSTGCGHASGEPLGTLKGQI